MKEEQKELKSEENSPEAKKASITKVGAVSKSIVGVKRKPMGGLGGLGGSLGKKKVWFNFNFNNN